MGQRRRDVPGNGNAPPAGEAGATRRHLDDDSEEIGRPEGMHERGGDPYASEPGASSRTESESQPPRPVSDRNVGGRTVERLGHREWTEVASSDPTPQESEHEPESESEPEPRSKRPLARERAEPQDEAPEAPGEREGPVYGRRRSRR